MNKIFFTTVFVTISVFLILVVTAVFTVNRVQASNPICIPAGCPDTYVPDFTCQYRKLLDPSDGCCENKCPGTASVSEPAEYTTLVSFFGRGIYLYSDAKIVSLINLAVTSFLAGISIFALVYGIYIAGVVRANTTDAAKIQETNKILQRLILGFILAWMFIFIMQVVMNLLGLGDLRQTVIFGSAPPNSTIIEIN